jgi:hypothetical protein
MLATGRAPSFDLDQVERRVVRRNENGKKTASSKWVNRCTAAQRQARRCFRKRKSIQGVSGFAGGRCELIALPWSSFKLRNRSLLRCEFSERAE